MPGLGSRAGRAVASSAAPRLAGHRDPQGSVGSRGGSRCPTEPVGYSSVGQEGTGTAMSQLKEGLKCAEAAVVEPWCPGKEDPGIPIFPGWL